MTPTERLRWATANRTRRMAELRDALDAVEESAQELHYARFLHAATSVDCPTCDTSAGSYCVIWRTGDGTYYAGANFYPLPEDRAVAFFIHPARSTTPEALFAASLP